MDKYTARYEVKRKAGISPFRKDGSLRDPESERQSCHAEEFAARELNSVFNDEVYEGDKGDDGYDFELKVRFPSGKTGLIRANAVWNGFATGSKVEPRMRGNLLLNPADEKKASSGLDRRYRNSLIFILVAGTVETGFKFLGWATKDEATKRPIKNFGFGRRFWVPSDELRSIDSLKSILVGD